MVNRFRTSSPASFRCTWRPRVALAVAFVCGVSAAAGALRGQDAGDETSLRPPEAFASIAEPGARSRALFEESAKVWLHPRCVNCHPSGDSPRMGIEERLHDPPVFRGKAGLGVAAMHCTSCHQKANADLARVPGAPHWLLAPRSMAWHGLSAREVCEQVKDPQRNGGRSLEELVEHVAHDDLVAWGWSPGAGRESAPGTQEGFAALVRAWAETGAACPQ